MTNSKTKVSQSMKYTDYFPEPYPVLVTNSDTEEEVKALLKKKALGEQDRRE